MAHTSTNKTTTSAVSAPPPITHVLETCLMVKNLGISTEFYKNVFKVEPFSNYYRTSGFSFSETTLLLFQLGATASDNTLPDNRGTIPGHGPSQNILDLLVPCGNPPSSFTQPPASLNQHFCLAVQSPDDVRAWEKWFDEKNVKILGRVDWELGGRSVYFADPDGNVGEVGSRGIWRHY